MWIKDIVYAMWKNKTAKLIFVIQAVVLLLLLANAFFVQEDIVLNVGNTVWSTKNVDGIERGAFAKEDIVLKPGAYDIQLEYIADEGPLNYDMAEGSVEINSKTNGGAILYNQVFINVGKSVSTGKVVINSVVPLTNLTISVEHNLDIGFDFLELRVEEKPIYNILIFLLWFLVFCIVDAAIYVIAIKENGMTEKHAIRLFMLVAIIFASLPAFVNFLYSSGDVTFHILRITSLANELSNIQLPVRMYTNVMFGYGYANPLFYCDFFLLIPAVLYNCSVPIFACYSIYLILVNAATMGIAYYSFKKMTGDAPVACIGAIIYTLGAYRIVVMYIRGAVGEYTGMTFLPLVVLGLYYIYVEEKPKFKQWVMLSLGMAAIICTHILTLELTVMFITLFVVILWKKTFQKEKFFALVKASLFTVCLSAWFLIPFLQSMIEVPTKVKSGQTLLGVQGFGIYPTQLLSIFLTPLGTYGGKYTKSDMITPIGVGLLLGVALIIYLASKRKATGPMYVCLLIGSIACLCAMHMFPWSALPELFGDNKIVQFITVFQFPFRMLVIAAVCLTTATTLGLYVLKKMDYTKYKIVVLVVLGSMIVTTSEFYTEFSYSENGLDLSFLEEGYSGMISVGEYLLDGSDQLATTIPEISTDGVRVTNEESVKGKYYASIENNHDEVELLAFPIFNYPNYEVKDVNTNEVFEHYSGMNNRITIDVTPGYSGDVMVQYKPPMLWRIAEIVSILTLLVLCNTFVLSKKK